jgi:hypothetical protein
MEPGFLFLRVIDYQWHVFTGKEMYLLTRPRARLVSKLNEAGLGHEVKMWDQKTPSRIYEGVREHQ